jgi:hypothetical protein
MFLQKSTLGSSFHTSSGVDIIYTTGFKDAVSFGCQNRNDHSLGFFVMPRL